MSEPETVAETPSPESRTDESLDARLVRELANVLNQTALSEIEFERGDLKIRVAKTLTAAPAAAVAVHAPAAIAAPSLETTATSAAATPAPAKPAGDLVKSPMVGTVYLQSQPGATPFIKIGDRVSQGQTLLLIEAMKTMNPIAASSAGTVLELLVADGQPVEYGEPLVVIGQSSV